MSQMPVAILMERRSCQHRWADIVWSAVEVRPDVGKAAEVEMLSQSDAHESYLVSGLQLELHTDENEGYFENWAAPEPKVFVMWQMRGQCAMPVSISLSYAEGTRMFDSGESADGLLMPKEIYSWLTDYLRMNYQPPKRKCRQLGEAL